ncbi:hypothetical protein ACQ4PT_028323 [Festuca glaucescens]
MGATASRSSPPTTTTRIVTIPYYSTFVRMPASGPVTFGTISFRDLLWIIKVFPEHVNKGVADVLVVSVVLNLRQHDIYCGAGTRISIEVLDDTGEHTVFHEEETLEAEGCPRDLVLQGKTCSTELVLNRRELEASSCVGQDRLAVRCTLSFVDTKKKNKKRRLIGSFAKSSRKPVALKPPVAMAGSHTITIASFSKLKAALRNEECAHSTHFPIGGSRWFLKLCPNEPRKFLSLVRAGSDETRARAEFSFEFQGAVNFKTQKMSHTFDRANAEHVFKYLLEPSTSDRLMVRCCLAVMPN